MIFKLVLLLSLVGCSTLNEKNNSNKVETSVKPKIKTEVQSIELFTGKVKFVEFQIYKKDGTYTLKCVDNKSKKTLFFPISVKSNMASLYMSENYFSKASTRKCYLESEKVIDLAASVFNYKKERLNVSKKHIDISKNNLARHIKEKKVRSKIYSESASYLLFDRPFKVPLSSYITSHFGNQRIFNNKKRSQHLGNDFRAAVGVKIPASNRGRVVFTGNWFFSGNIVIIDHGMNIFTNYMHLSKILVTPGTIVNQGDIIGLAGKTGRVSGPHLHWGAKVNGNNVDGFSLVNASKQHFID